MKVEPGVEIVYCIAMVSERKQKWFRVKNLQGVQCSGNDNMKGN